ncbi:MAG: sigma-70 region 4 domain-containing protein [Bacteroidetes bacterium]|nr:sigma-70 region 4 domain-containing protein [Bacteroidota bacterium]
MLLIFAGKKHWQTPTIFRNIQYHANIHSGCFRNKEHITFCLTCISKSLPLEQQLCLLLKEIYDFKVSEIAEILQTNESMIKYYLHTSREKWSIFTKVVVH